MGLSSNLCQIEDAIRPEVPVHGRHRIAVRGLKRRPADRSEQFRQGGDRGDLGEHQRSDPLGEIDLGARRCAAHLLDLLRNACMAWLTQSER